jgi:hypothetical protein
LHYVEPSDIDLEELTLQLGPRVEDLRTLLLQVSTSDIIDKKVECGYQKVITKFSSKQQGLSLSKLFQTRGV